MLFPRFRSFTFYCYFITDLHTVSAFSPVLFRILLGHFMDFRNI